MENKTRVSNTSERLKQLVNDRHLKQVDILDLVKPFCEKYGEKINKSHLSQWVSGVNEPNQNKLFILGQALNVSEPWLMGYDVPMERNTYPILNSEDAKDLAELTLKFSQLSPSGKKRLLFSADLIYQMEEHHKVQSGNQELNEEFLHNMTG